MGEILRKATARGGSMSGGDDHGVGTAASFSGPMGIAADGRGNLYVNDVDAHTIRKVVIATRTVTMIAGVAGTPGSADGVGTAALFSTDFTNQNIRAYGLDTGRVSTLAGALGEQGANDGVGVAAHFSVPLGIASDSSGTVYAADLFNNAVRKL